MASINDRAKEEVLKDLGFLKVTNGKFIIMTDQCCFTIDLFKNSILVEHYSIDREVIYDLPMFFISNSDFKNFISVIIESEFLLSNTAEIIKNKKT